jgi:hypothetical protein
MEFLSPAGLAIAVWVIGLAAASIGVNVYLSNWSKSHERVREGIAAHVDPEAVLVCNLDGVEKFIERFDYRYDPVDHQKNEISDVRAVLDRYGEFYLVLLDRNESDLWRRIAEENADFASAFEANLTPLLNEEVSSTTTLRIWKASRDTDS